MTKWTKPWIRLALLAAVAITLAGASTGSTNLATASTLQVHSPAPAVRADQTSFVANFKGDWPAEAKAAWDIAAASLATHITVTVPVVVELTWGPLDTNTLGMAGPSASYINFTGAPRADTFFPSALANQFAGARQADGSDVQVSINSTSKWTFTGDPQGALAAGSNDLVTTIMHEVIHGMGFLGTGDAATDQGKWGEENANLAPIKRLVAHGRFSCSLLVIGSSDTVATVATVFPDIWDQFVVNGSGQAIVDTTQFANPSPELAAQLTSGNLFWNGNAGKAANGGAPIKLFAPSPWSPASSYSHLDDAIYDGGTDAILTSAGSNLPNTDVGPRILGMLADMGWTIK